MHDRELHYGLAAWAVCAALIFVLGVGFAGGLENVFILPEGDLLSIALALIGRIFVFSPIVVIPAILVINRRRRRRDIS
jgi:hypothetical protein